jgi:aryl-alcohol dehydrogenase-like predicted oxidoreductase
MHNYQRMIIGTAQFGMHYGIAGARKNSLNAVKSIVGLARQYGIDSFDTAPVYGDAERVLGKVGVSGSRITTKLPPLLPGYNDIKAFVESHVSNSISCMRLDKVEELLVHNPQDLIGENGDALYGALLDLKNRGLVRRVGVSVYTPTELALLSSIYKFDTIQLPFNVFDRRFVESDLVARLKLSGVELHARSIFLQGLLLMKRDRVPVKFEKWNHLFEKFDAYCSELGLSRLAYCLAYVFHEPLIDRVLIGVNSMQQLEEIVQSLKVDIQNRPKAIEGSGWLIRPDMWGSLV